MLIHTHHQLLFLLLMSCITQSMDFLPEKIVPEKIVLDTRPLSAFSTVVPQSFFQQTSMVTQTVQLFAALNTMQLQPVPLQQNQESMPASLTNDSASVAQPSEFRDQGKTTKTTANTQTIRKPLRLRKYPLTLNKFRALPQQKGLEKAHDKRLAKLKKFDDSRYAVNSFTQASKQKSARYACNLCNKPFNSVAAFDKHKRFCLQKDKGKIALRNVVINKKIKIKRFYSTQPPIVPSLPPKELLQS